jgi:hypothetical protein
MLAGEVLRQWESMIFFFDKQQEIIPAILFNAIVATQHCTVLIWIAA